MKLQVIKKLLINKSGKVGLIIQKHSPEIMLGVGVVGVVASTVLACRATLKVGDVIDEAKNNLDKIEFTKKNINKDKYSDEDATKDKAITFAQAGVKILKLYGPPVLLGAASIGCIIGSHGIMRKRNFAIVAAYKAVEQSFKDYRKRVTEEFGEEKDRLLKNGIVQSKISVVELDENGKSKKSQKTIENVDPNGVSQYARFFDESSINWSKTPEYNLTYLRCQQNLANDLLNARGHIFLNEVYDMIGVPRSQAGQMVGWVKGVGDGFVDFGIFTGKTLATRDFVNGYERSILLDFNVDGVIYDMI